MQSVSESQLPHVPVEPWRRLFLRFLKFGLLAWGGPVAQIAMIREELVDEERWVSREQFNRALAIYQVLPGPEAHELCVYFGMLSRGRLGGFLAGLGFMLPGFLLMFFMSALYASGVHSMWLTAAFLGVQPAVVGLIIRAVHRIGQHALTDRVLWALAGLVAVASLLGTPFWITLPLAGLAYLFVSHRQRVAVGVAVLALLVSGLFLFWVSATSPGASRHTDVFGAVTAQAGNPTPPASTVSVRGTSVGRLFGSGLRAGMLTFGGAYTVIPFLRNDAVVVGRWMTDPQFLDGLALSGILPAPLIIFSTFVGYLGGGPVGAVAVTVGIFLPAFAFTLVAHRAIERIVQNRLVHTFLDGVTAGVVGLISATALDLLRATVRDLPALLILVVSLVVLYRWRAKGAIAVVIAAAAVAGLVVYSF
ncbi:MAG TPA: chromate efflux transporter [bacterium]